MQIQSQNSYRVSRHRARPFTKHERAQLNMLLGQVLVDPTLYNELIEQRSKRLMDKFDIPEHIQHWLSALPAATLEDVAAAIAYHP